MTKPWSDFRDAVLQSSQSCASSSLLQEADRLFSTGTCQAPRVGLNHQTQDKKLLPTNAAEHIHKARCLLQHDARTRRAVRSNVRLHWRVFRLGSNQLRRHFSTRSHSARGAAGWSGTLPFFSPSLLPGVVPANLCHSSLQQVEKPSTAWGTDADFINTPPPKVEGFPSAPEGRGAK